MHSVTFSASKLPVEWPHLILQFLNEMEKTRGDTVVCITPQQKKSRLQICEECACFPCVSTNIWKHISSVTWGVSVAQCCEYACGLSALRVPSLEQTDCQEFTSPLAHCDINRWIKKKKNSTQVTNITNTKSQSLMLEMENNLPTDKN